MQIGQRAGDEGVSLERQERILYVMLSGLLVVCIATGLLVEGGGAALAGLFEILVHPARLIQDYSAVGNTGSALINASLVALIALILIRVTRIALSGPTVAAFFTLFGFGLFGKTPLNILPIILGVFIAAKIAGKQFREYLLIALFGTALGPLVSFFVLEFGLPLPISLITGMAAGIAAGILLPSVAMAMLHLHQGYNLYNMGMTCGFVGLFAASLIIASGGDLSIRVVWSETADPVLIFLVPFVSLYLIAFALFLDARRAFGDCVSLTRLSGRLPSDFIDSVSAAGALLNAGLLGLIFWLYIILIGADLNGPVLGGIFTVIGFGTFGKHLKNTIPVALGVLIAAIVFSKPLDGPGVVLAVLFSTALAPIAGEFGAFTGLAAGCVHLLMVERTGAWHGGIDLYNNGFAGGLTAALFISVIEWFRSSRPDDFGDSFQ